MPTLPGLTARASSCSHLAGDLLEPLVAAVLAGRPPAEGAASALSAMGASCDGARLLLHTARLLPRALEALSVAADARSAPPVLPLLQVLAALCTQPEAQRAALACCTGARRSLLDVLLELAARLEHGAVAEAAMCVVRSLSLCPDAAAHFTAKRHALQTLVSAVAAAGEQPGRAAAAAHALWTLVHGSGRVKVAVRRCPGWADSLAAGSSVCEEAGSSGAVLREACPILQRVLA